MNFPTCMCLLHSLLILIFFFSFCFFFSALFFITLCIIFIHAAIFFSYPAKASDRSGCWGRTFGLFHDLHDFFNTLEGKGWIFFPVVHGLSCLCQFPWQVLQEPWMALDFFNCDPL
ncbi:hypothetical protein OIU78_010720 [Salix suchowensis]|nr:hypothetical protein OIU78_010720 [Salix suchowensis]